MASEMIWDCYVSPKVEYWCCFNAQKGNVNIPFKFWILLCFVLPFKCLRFILHWTSFMRLELMAGNSILSHVRDQCMHVQYHLVSHHRYNKWLPYHIILDVSGLGNHFLKNKLLSLRLSWKLLIINYYYYIWIDII